MAYLSNGTCSFIRASISNIESPNVEEPTLLSVDTKTRFQSGGTRNGVIRLLDAQTASLFNINQSEVGKWAIIIPKAPVVTFHTYDEALSFLVH